MSEKRYTPKETMTTFAVHSEEYASSTILCFVECLKDSSKRKEDESEPMNVMMFKNTSLITKWKVILQVILGLDVISIGFVRLCTHSVKYAAALPDDQ